MADPASPFWLIVLALLLFGLVGFTALYVVPEIRARLAWRREQARIQRTIDAMAADRQRPR